METKVDIKSKILDIAKSSGVEIDVAEKIAQKCMDDMPMMWRPYGGATSFADIDEKQHADHYTMEIDEQTYALRSVIENITASEDLNSADSKAAAISKAAEDYRKRVNAITDEHKTPHNSILEKVQAMFGLGRKPVFVEELKTNHGIKIYKDKQGNSRWLTHSSNAFEDLDKELFTTKALEEAVEYADKSGERGPLMFYHIPGTEVGQCDYQAVVGRFLVESGTFLDTPLGVKAREYLQETEDEHQVSIGYEYRDGDELDGVYDWLRVKERSFLPYGTAANPWTDFKLIGVKEMDQRHQEALETVFGKELATSIITGAEERTKELEANVAFKAKKPMSVADMEDMADGGADDSSEDANGKKLPPKKKEGELFAPVVESAGAMSSEQLTGLATILTDLSTQMSQLAGLKDVVVGMQEEIKELKKSDDEKIASQMSPRFDPTRQGTRPSESSANVLDEKTLAGLKHVVDNDQEAPVAPAQQYVNDLLKVVMPAGSSN